MMNSPLLLSVVSFQYPFMMSIFLNKHIISFMTVAITLTLIDLTYSDPRSTIKLNLILAPHIDQQSACLREMINANKSLSTWADNLEDMVNESVLPDNIKLALHEETDRVLDMIGDFGDNLDKLPVEQLSRDLVNIRRRSNRLALDIYLNTFDMRWPQTSMHLGVLVERVQQACGSISGQVNHSRNQSI